MSSRRRHGSRNAGAQQTPAGLGEQPSGGLALPWGEALSTWCCYGRCQGWGQFTQRGWAGDAAASERQFWNYLRMLSSPARLYLVLPVFAFTFGLLQRRYPSIPPHREQKNGDCIEQQAPVSCWLGTLMGAALSPAKADGGLGAS